MRRVWEFWVNVVVAFAPFLEREIFENGGIVEVVLSSVFFKDIEN